jgi:raffinose/stachyose/melibiose transport system permease protein
VQIARRGTTRRVGWLNSIPAYSYLAPALVLYAIFFLWPLTRLIQLSTVTWKGLGQKTFVGLGNYQKLLTSDPNVWLALKHNLVWMAFAVILPVAIGLFLAVFLSRSSIHGRLLFRTIYFLPYVLSSAAVAVIWRGMYNPNYGAVNGILETVGLEALTRGWLGDRTVALAALFIAWTWAAYGLGMVIFLAALQGIEETYYDAAKVDGANALQQFWYVTLPFIRRPLATVILLRIIAAFQVFDLVYIMTEGGPANATLVLSIHMFDAAFRYSRVGYGATIAVFLGLLILVLTIAFQRVRNRLEV